MQIDSIWWIAAVLPIEVGVLALALCYLSAIVLLCQRPQWQRRLSLFAPIGRMALTNYLAQTLINLFIFYGYGLGLMGRMSPVFCLPLSLLVFGLQIIFSRWWLRCFQSGPAEWLWRSLSYGSWQPLRLPRPQLALDR